MDEFINVIISDPEVQIKIKGMLDKYIKLPCNYQSKIGYDTSIQNVIHKEIIILMSIVLVDIDIELKKKICRIKNLESKLIRIFSFILL